MRSKRASRMNPCDTMQYPSNQWGHSCGLQDVLMSSKTRSSWVHTEKQRGKKQRAIPSCAVWAQCAENCEPLLPCFFFLFPSIFLIWRFWSHLRKFPLFWETSKSEFRNAEMFRRSEFLLGHRHRFRFRRFREAPKGELLVDQSRTSPGRGAAQRSGVEWRKLSREEETKKRRCFKHF